MAGPTHPRDGFARLAAHVAENGLRETFAQDPAGAFGAANGWSAELLDLQGEPALGGIVLHRAGGHLGPFSEEAARRSLAEGVLKAEDAAWDSRQRCWTTLGRLLGLTPPVAATTHDSPPLPASPPPPVPSSDILIYRNEHESVAYTPADALAAVARGELRPEDWAWNETLKDWVPLRALLSIPSNPEPAPASVTHAPAAGEISGTAESRATQAGLVGDRDLLEKKVAGLEKHLAQALKACASLDRLKDELAAAQQQVRERHAEVEARSREISSWQVRASEAEATLAGLREENTELRARATAAQRAYSDLESRLQGAAKLNQELERLQRELTAARMQATTSANEAANLQRELESAKATVETARIALENQEERIAGLEEDAARTVELEARLAEAAAHLDTARAILVKH